MKYTIELINNRPQCRVATYDRKFFILEDYELYQLIKNIKEDRRFREHNHNTKNLFLKHSKMDISILFKDYEALYEPLYKLYNKFTKQEIRKQKIQSIKTKTAIGVLTSGIITLALANNLKIDVNNIKNIFKEDITQESLFNPLEVTAKKLDSSSITIEDNDAYFTSTNSNISEKTSEDELKYIPPQKPVAFESKSTLEPIQVDVNAVYDKGINDRTDPYIDDINKYAARRGISPDLLYDIVSQEYGGSGSNLMHVVFDSWKDQIIPTFNFDSNVLESIVLTDNPSNYYGKADIIITRDDLKISKTNLAVGTIILQYSLTQFDYNIPLGIQAYNNGVGAVNKIVNATSEGTGLSTDQIIDTMDPIWLSYTDVIEQGDENYFKNVVKHIDEDEQESKTNGVYSIQYMEDGILQTNEAQFKLR